MLTESIWNDFNRKLDKKNYGVFYTTTIPVYSNYELGWWLLGTIAATPFTVILDVVFLPIEISYWVCLKIVKKLRKKVEER